MIFMEILKTISSAGTVDVLVSLGKGPRRFTDVMFETKLNPGILNRVLKGLLKAGVIKRCDSGLGYDLTEKGMKVSLYAFRIIEESGTSGPEDNEMIETLTKRLEAIHA